MTRGEQWVAVIATLVLFLAVTLIATSVHALIQADHCHLGAACQI